MNDSKMGNDNFRFKQFTVFHNKCAMKVGTDGVLLGAWANLEDCESILDIGTGTGIIALMAAQRSNAEIEAIDIEKNACLQATENIENSPWPTRINVHNESLQLFAEKTEKKYSHIISNPPFFCNSLLSDDKNRQLARHPISLS